MIQKNIFFIWIGKELPVYANKTIQAFRDVNPDFNIRLIWEKNIYNPENEDVKETLDIINSDNDSFIKRFYSRSYTKRFSDSRRHLTNVSNCLRWHLVNKYGGIYLDLDTFPVKPFDDFLINRKNFIVSAHDNKPDIFFFSMERGTLQDDDFIYFEEGMKEYDIHSTELLVKYPWFQLRKFIHKQEDDAKIKFMSLEFEYGKDSVFSRDHVEHYYIDHLFVRNWHINDIQETVSFRNSITLQELFSKSFVISIDDKRYNVFRDDFLSHNLILPELWHGIKFNIKDQPQLSIAGCSASHISLIKLAKYNKFPFICVFEDDAYPCWNIYEQLTSALQHIPSDTDAYVLGHLMADGQNCGNGNIKIDKLYGSHAYIIFEHAYDKYLSAFENNTSVSDRILEHMNTYAYGQSMFNQRISNCIHSDKWHKMTAFDLGAYDGKDTEFMANNGFNVISIEANPVKANTITEKFKNYTGIKVENKCIVENKDITQCDFYVSSSDSAWDSCNKNIAERESDSSRIKVNCCTIIKLIEKYGCPYYLKCDIEGNDLIVLKQLAESEYRPRYVSCESECQGNIYDPSKRYEILDALYNMGYTRFSLINQYIIGNMIRILPDNINNWSTYDEAKEKLNTIADNQLKTYKKPWSVWIDIYAKI